MFFFNNRNGRIIASDFRRFCRGQNHQSIGYIGWFIAPLTSLIYLPYTVTLVINQLSIFKYPLIISQFPRMGHFVQLGKSSKLGPDGAT